MVNEQALLFTEALIEVESDDSRFKRDEGGGGGGKSSPSVRSPSTAWEGFPGNVSITTGGGGRIGDEVEGGEGIGELTGHGLEVDSSLVVEKDRSAGELTLIED